MYKSSKDNLIVMYVDCIYIYVCRFLKLAGWYLASCIYMYVCRFLNLASLSKLIFGRFFLNKKKRFCVCVCGGGVGSLKLVGWIHWYLAGYIYKYICGFYIDIWQDWWNMYVCGFLKLASLSTLIFGKFFHKKKNGRLLKIYVYVSIYVENITVGKMWIYIRWKYDNGKMQRLYWKCDHWNIYWIRKKKKMTERNNKKILKNNILIKWYWKCNCGNSCWIWKKKWRLERNIKK